MKLKIGGDIMKLLFNILILVATLANAHQLRKEVGPKLVKFLSLSNNSELYRSNAEITFLASFASLGGLYKDAKITRWS
jgi:hypothetical protein